jgi:hypothetical protein
MAPDRELQTVAVVTALAYATIIIAALYAVVN